MEEGLIAGAYLAFSCIAGGVVLGVISVPVYAGLWFLRK